MSRGMHPHPTDRCPTPSAPPHPDDLSPPIPDLRPCARIPLPFPPPASARSRAASTRYAEEGCGEGPRAGAPWVRFSKRSLPLGKQMSKKKRRIARSLATAEIIAFQGAKFEAERAPPPIKALNPTQGDYLDALMSSPQVVVLGPAGTGKTWIAATH